MEHGPDPPEVESAGAEWAAAAGLAGAMMIVAMAIAMYETISVVWKTTLDETVRMKVKVNVSYAPTGGTPNS